MKNRFVWFFIAILSLFFALWVVSIIRCEILTFQHRNEFKGLEIKTNMLPATETIKVLSYTDETAIVLYRKRRYYTCVFKFIKKNGEWIRVSWNTIWSNTGNADGFIWPYIR